MHAMIAPARSTIMNRQAVPSIFLSVAIVCFFAVALYQRDVDPRRAMKPDRTTKAVPPDVPSTDRAEATPKGGMRATQPQETPRDRIAVAAPARADETINGLAATGSSKSTAPPRAGGKPEPTVAAPTPPIRTVATRSAVAAASQPHSQAVRADRARPSGWKPASSGREASSSTTTGRSGNR
jgi:hypothetical protein